MKISVLVMVLCVAAGMAWADPTLQLVPSTNTVTVGDMVSLDLNIMGLGSAGAMEVGSFDSYIGFDPALLTPTGATFTLLLGDPGLFEAITAYAKGPYWADAADVSLLSVAELDAMQPSSFTLATYSFTALASGTVNFTYLGGPVDNGNGDLIAGSKYVPVPEPPTMLLALPGLAAGWRKLRRRGVRIPGLPRSAGMAGILKMLAVTLVAGLLAQQLAAQACLFNYDSSGARTGCKQPGAACNGGRGVCTNTGNILNPCPCLAPPPPPPKCKDPGATMTLLSSPISSFPATRTFTPMGNTMISGLTPSPVNVPITGSMTVLFQQAGSPLVMTGTIQSLDLSFPSITLTNGDSTGPNTVTLHGSQALQIDPTTGATSGSIWTRASNSLGNFETGSPVMGSLDFSTGQWTLTTLDSNCLRCDINGDGQVDIDDINLILGSRNSVAGLNDPRDVDSDGIVTANDARICALACKNPHCAK